MPDGQTAQDKDNPPCPTCGQIKPSDIDYMDDDACRKLCREELVIALRNNRGKSVVSNLANALLDRIDGKAQQSIALDVKDDRLDKIEVDKLIRMAAMLDDPILIAPMPKKLDIDENACG